MGKKQRNPGDSWTLGTVRGTDPDRAYQIEAFVCSWTGLEWPIATHSARSQHSIADTAHSLLYHRVRRRSLAMHLGSACLLHRQV